MLPILLLSRVPKRIAAIDFSRDGMDVLVADRTGDVHSVSVTALLSRNNIVTVAEQGILDISEDDIPLVGHYSMITDMSLSPKFIATSDRDNKIRVSNYPKSFDIQSFCLGHVDFVARIIWVDELRLLSGGGDTYIRLWNALNGAELSSVSIRHSLSERTQASFDESVGCVVIGISTHPQNRDIAVVVLHKFSCLIVIEGITSNNLHISKLLSVSDVQGGNNAVLTGALFDQKGQLWVSVRDTPIVCAYTFPGTPCDEKFTSPVEKFEVPAPSKHAQGKISDHEFQSTGDWLSGLRKKQFIECWKGKKRKRVDAE